MKKLLTVSFLTLAIILISGCSLIEQESIDNSAMVEQITALQEQINDFSYQMEDLKIENEQLKSENQEFKKIPKKENNLENKQETNFDPTKIKIEEEYQGYSYKEGNIVIRSLCQDGCSISLYYENSGNVIKKEKNIIWFDIGYSEKNPVKGHIRCLEKCDINGCKEDKWTNKEAYGLDQCKTIKILNGCEDDLYRDEKSKCKENLFKYMFNLINGIETNDYFSEKFDGFIKGL